MSCLFCKSNLNQESVEHIVPQALGNIHYILRKGIVCASCNNIFSRFERKVLSSKIFVAERKIYGDDADFRTLQKQDLKRNTYARFLLKIGIESMFRSRRKMWYTYDFSSEIDMILGKKDIAESTTISEDYSHLKWNSIPRWVDRYRLRSCHVDLSYAKAESNLIFCFQYGRIRSKVLLGKSIHS